MRKSYHTALFQKYKDEGKRGYCDYLDGYRTAYIDNFAHGLADNRRKAIRLSRHIGEEVVDHTCFSETEDLEKGLAFTAVMCYTSEKGVVQSVTFDIYKNGEFVETKEIKYK